MIVVDTSVIAYLFIKGAYSDNAAALLKADSKWLAPLLWRSEFRNVLTLYFRKGWLSPREAQSIMNEAEELLYGNEYEVSSYEIFDLTSSSNCSAYDCEFAALAKHLKLKLYTSDKLLLKEFPDITADLKNFTSS